MEKNKLNRILLKLEEEKYFDKYQYLSFLDIPREKDLKGKSLPILNDNQLFLFVASDYSDVKINTEFDVIFPYQNINEFVYTKIILKYVSVNPSYEIDYIPKGYSALCLFEFEDIKLKMLSKLAYYKDKKEYLIHDNLVITQISLLKKILEFSY